MSTDVVSSVVSPPGNALTRIAAMVRINTIMLIREPGPVASRLIMPLVMITVLEPLFRAALRDSGEETGTTQVIAGMLVMFSLLALSIVGSAMLTERAWRTWDRLRATPAASWELLAGKAVRKVIVVPGKMINLVTD